MYCVGPELTSRGILKSRGRALLSYMWIPQAEIGPGKYILRKVEYSIMKLFKRLSISKIFLTIYGILSCKI